MVGLFDSLASSLASEITWLSVDACFATAFRCVYYAKFKFMLFVTCIVAPPILGWLDVLAGFFVLIIYDWFTLVSHVVLTSVGNFLPPAIYGDVTIIYSPLSLKFWLSFLFVFCLDYSRWRKWCAVYFSTCVTVLSVYTSIYGPFLPSYIPSWVILRSALYFFFLSRIALLRVIDFLRAASGPRTVSSSSAVKLWDTLKFCTVFSSYFIWEAGVNPPATVLLAIFMNCSLLILLIYRPVLGW